MITTVTMNAAIDKTYYLPAFPHGKVSRVRQYLAAPGGKGINVAKVAAQLGAEVTASGIVGGMNGEIIKKQLDDMSIAHQFVAVEGESRLCLNIIDEETGSSTELLEPGPVVDNQALDAMEQTIATLARTSKVVCISGSLPAGAPADYYIRLVGSAKKEGAYVILDASGDALRFGLQANPDMIKPNEEEVAALLGTGIRDEQELLRAMEDLLREYRMERVCVSLGGAGSLTVTSQGRYRAVTPPIQVVNTVGCGDSFVAGMAVSLLKQLPAEEGIAMAAAAGTANALSAMAGSVDPDTFRRLLGQVEISRI